MAEINLNKNETMKVLRRLLFDISDTFREPSLPPLNNGYSRRIDQNS